MADEWGPWRMHHGRGFPECLRGVLIEIEVQQFTGRTKREVGITTFRTATEHWDWRNFGKCSDRGWYWARVLAYRIHKPRGALILEQILADLPQPVDPVHG